MLLSEVWNEYKGDKEVDNYSPETLEQYELYSKLFIRWAGDIPIKDVSARMMKKYLRKDSDRLEANSIASRIKYFRSVWRWAHEEGIIETNEASKVNKPKDKKRAPKHMDIETVEKLRMGCETILETCILETFFTTGCRSSEIHQASLEDVNLENRTIRIIGKNDKEGDVFFSVKCAIWLQKYLNSRDDNNPALFVTERRFKDNGGQPRRLSKDQMNRIVKRIGKRVGIHDIHLHVFRHTYAMYLMSKNCELPVISSLLRHANISTTKIYADYTSDIRKRHYDQYF